MNNLLDKSEVPAWFTYPKEFLRLMDQNILTFEPWFILTGDQLRIRFKGLKERYPRRNLVPFARRSDNDDVACWEENKSGNIVLIHDFASEGWEDKEIISDFWTWFKKAIEEMIEAE